MDSHVLVNGWVWFRWVPPPGSRTETICINVAHVEAVAGLEGRDGAAVYMTSGQKHVVPNASATDVALQFCHAQTYIDGTHRVLEKQEEQRDEIEQFVSDRCIIGDRDGSNSELYEAYVEWCRENDEVERSQKWFTRALMLCGYRQSPSRTHGRRWERLSV